MPWFGSRWRRAVVIPAALAVAFTAGSVAPATATWPVSDSVQLLALNDFHGALEPPSSTINGVEAGGVEYLGTHLKRLRQGQQRSAFVAAGDLVGASPLVSALFHDEPTIQAMNQLGLRASSVGNHEFDEGFRELLRLQRGGCHPTDGCLDGTPYPGADFQYLSANVIRESTGRPLFPATKVLNLDGIKIGLIGLVLEETPSIVTAEGVAGLEFRPEVAAANEAAVRLRAQGVRTIVTLIHQGGFDATPEINDCVDFQGDLAEIVPALHPDIDVVVSGHTHASYVCHIDGRLVTSTASSGRVVTDIRLQVNRKTGDVVAKRAHNVVVTRDVPKDPQMTRLVNRYQRLADPIANRVVGRITETITRDPAPSGESPLGNLIADAQLAATREEGAVAAFMNPGGVREDLVYAPTGAEAPGEVTYGEAFTVQPFNNYLVTMTLTGEQVLRLLEQQFEVERVLAPSGITYAYDPDQPVGQRIIEDSVVIGGDPLSPGAEYRITVNSFLAGGGDDFTVLTEGTNLVFGGLDIDAFVAYLGANSPVAPPATNRITVR